MPIALVTTPDEFALTKGGRMLYEFAGSGRLATKGVKSSCVLFTISAVTDGTTLTMRWNGTDYVLKFVAKPVEPNEFPSGDGSRTYLRTLLAKLKGYYPFRNDFILSEYDPTQAPGIVFTARQAGPAYDVSAVMKVGTPFAFGSTTFGALPLLRTQYSVYAEVWLQRPGTTGENVDTDYDLIFSPTIETKEDGSAQMDVGKVLHAKLTADWPVWATAAPVHNVGSARKYFVCYGEAYGSPIQIGSIAQDQIRFAYLGGKNYVQRANGGLNLLTGQTASAAGDKALRFGELTRFVRPDEPQYLSFLNSRADQAGCLLQITRVFDNDNGDVRRNRVPAQTVLKGDKITYSAGPAQLDLFTDLPAGRSLKEYTIQRIASDEATVLSDVYRYVLNYDYQEYTRYFAYLNSFGAVDTLVTFGKQTRELQRFYEQAEKYVPALYEVADGQFTDYNVAIQKQFDVTTGYRSEAELRTWDDFYRSAFRFRLVNSRAMPIQLTSKSIQQTKDGDTLFAHKFSYVYAFQDDFYSEEPASTDQQPPVGFQGAGGSTITVQPTVTVVASDPTVPDAVRDLTAGVINNFKQAFAWGNHAAAGYLTQALGSTLFRRNDQPVSYPELANKPTTRDEAGLRDVPNRSDIYKLIHIQPHLTAWSTDQDPPLR